MTVGEAIVIAKEKLGRNPSGMCVEYADMFCFRAFPGQRLYVMKNTREAVFEDDLSDKELPKDRIRLVPIQWSEIT